LRFRDINQNGADNADQYGGGITKANAREMQAIKEKAVKDGTFMKAPSGKPTKLNERQWLQVRTTNFKKWFGDWELEADLLTLYNNNTIDYEKLKNVSGRIQAERERTSGTPKTVAGTGKRIGNRNDEASLVTGAVKRTDGAYESGNRKWAEHKKLVAKQETALEEYAKKEGIWFGDYGIFEREYGKLNEGTESEIWGDKDSGTHLIKTFGYDFAKQTDPDTFIKERVTQQRKRREGRLPLLQTILNWCLILLNMQTR
jgi:hypothetical protein